MGALYLLSAALAAAPIRFRDVTDGTGISFQHTDGGSGRHYLVEGVSAGLALFDYDGDGDIDIYLLNGAPLKGTQTTRRPRNALYRNEGGFRFTDVTDMAGVGDTGHGLGVAVGDYDNDGDPDLYLNNFGPNVLYRNNGDGTFTDVTEAAGVGNGNRVGAGANFLDIDKDGDLDLFVSNYIKFSYELHVLRTKWGYPIYPSPAEYESDEETLYRNNGDGTFTDISAASGVGRHPGPGMGTVCGDFDRDGDTDIFVANDVAANFLFENDGTGKFREVGLVAGVAYDLGADAYGNMGADCGDYDNDGRLDLHVTSYANEMATLYRNFGNLFFEDVTRPARAGTSTFCPGTWGNGFADFDNDGDRDLFIACGHIQDNVAHFREGSTYHQRNLVLMNTGDGKFRNVSDQCGDGLAVKLSSRGAGFDDLDNDGDIDVVILNARRETTILRNDSPSENRWLQVRLRGTTANRDGVGSLVRVVAGDLAQIAEVHSGRGYQSHFGTRLHFGLGKRDRVDRIEIRWLGGGVGVLENVPVNRLVTITEGSTQAKTRRPARNQ